MPDQGPVTIEVATHSDLAQLAQLHHDHLAYHEPFDPRYRPQPASAYRHTIREYCDDPCARYYLARCGGEAAGFVLCRVHSATVSLAGGGFWQRLRQAPEIRGSSASILDLFVAEAYRRKGVGSALMAAAVGWLQACGVQELNLGVMVGNTLGEAFWASQGFQPYRLQMRRNL